LSSWCSAARILGSPDMSQARDKNTKRSTCGFTWALDPGREAMQADGRLEFKRPEVRLAPSSSSAAAASGLAPPPPLPPRAPPSSSAAASGLAPFPLPAPLLISRRRLWAFPHPSSCSSAAAAAACLAPPPLPPLPPPPPQGTQLPIGLAQIVGQVQASDMYSQSKHWPSSTIWANQRCGVGAGGGGGDLLCRGL
jgi:hypothetical protein